MKTQVVFKDSLIAYLAALPYPATVKGLKKAEKAVKETRLSTRLILRMLKEVRSQAFK
jgi:hypothetical protein